jgi:glucose/mannose-6-phosphate isomerase
MYGSLGAMPDQVEAAWADMAGRTFPPACRSASHIVVAGMGGSALGTHLIQSVFRDRLAVPITIVSDYVLPAWVNRDMLVLLSSYSGGTEEVLAVAEQALRASIPLVALTTGGALAGFAETHGLPAVVFRSEHNPCGQPRAGLGYAVAYQLGIFRQLGVIDLTDGEMEWAIHLLRNRNALYADLSRENPALDLAQRARLRIPLLIAAEHFAGNAHILANQWNENAKSLAAYFLIPELNHHLLEGLTGPPAVRNRLLAVLIESDRYDDRNRKRFAITRQVLEEQRIAVLALTPYGDALIDQAFDLLLLGSYASFYQAVLNRINPTPIPWVDHFKRLMRG